MASLAAWVSWCVCRIIRNLTMLKNRLSLVKLPAIFSPGQPPTKISVKLKAAHPKKMQRHIRGKCGSAFTSTFWSARLLDLPFLRTFPQLLTHEWRVPRFLYRARFLTKSNYRLKLSFLQPSSINWSTFALVDVIQNLAESRSSTCPSRPSWWSARPWGRWLGVQAPRLGRRERSCSVPG